LGDRVPVVSNGRVDRSGGELAALLHGGGDSGVIQADRGEGPPFGGGFLAVGDAAVVEAVGGGRGGVAVRGGGLSGGRSQGGVGAGAGCEGDGVRPAAS
jgi:hypothetical protein